MTCFPMDVPIGVPYLATVLACDATAPRTTRALAVSAVDGWDMRAIRDDVELVTCELVTNAVRSGTRIAVLIALRPGADQIEVAVWDDGPGVPEPRPQCPDAERGRGLFVVGAFSGAWGCRPGRDGLGKITWTTLGPKPRANGDAQS